MTENKCGVSISSIFDTVFRYFPIFLTVLRYWVPPNVPPRSDDAAGGLVNVLCVMSVSVMMMVMRPDVIRVEFFSMQVSGPNRSC